MPIARVLLLVACSSLVTTEALAFCRAATKDPVQSSCNCSMRGIPLAWRVREVDVKLNRRGFAGLSDDAVRDVAQQALDAWTDVTCDGEPMGMTVRVLPETTSYTIGPACPAGLDRAPNGELCEPNDNTISYFNGDDWVAEGLDSTAYALTSQWFDTETGELVGADTYYNGGIGMLAECEATGCAAGVNDFLNVATHEAGHFFGLAHTDVAGSTMACAAAPGDTQKRTLESDDIAGICDAYGTNAEFEDEPPQSSRSSAAGGCQALHGRADGAHMLPVALFSLLLPWRRRRKAKSA